MVHLESWGKLREFTMPSDIMQTLLNGTFSVPLIFSRFKNTHLLSEVLDLITQA